VSNIELYIGVSTRVQQVNHKSTSWLEMFDYNYHIYTKSVNRNTNIEISISRVFTLPNPQTTPIQKPWLRPEKKKGGI
jgi:hypothetical protein